MNVSIREKPKGSGEWWIFINHHGKRMSKKIGRDNKLAREVAGKSESRLVLGDMALGDEQKAAVPTLKDSTSSGLWTDDRSIMALFSRRRANDFFIRSRRRRKYEKGWTYGSQIHRVQPWMAEPCGRKVRRISISMRTRPSVRTTG